jgi:hypothetical protein
MRREGWLLFVSNRVSNFRIALMIGGNGCALLVTHAEARV